MKRIKRTFTQDEKDLVFNLWKQGTGFSDIGRVLDAAPGTVFTALRESGGIQPKPQTRNSQHLTLAEREEIRVALSAKISLRAIARMLNRSPSTISREIARNRGRRYYKAVDADNRAKRMAKRPKLGILELNLELKQVVISKLELNWSPEQISGWLRVEHSRRKSMQVSHETIYKSIYVSVPKELFTTLLRSICAGDIVKVTPSSKVVGDMALMMVSQNLTREQVEDSNVDVAFPDSVIDMMKGNLGQPPGGFPQGIQKKVLKGDKPMTTRPGESLKLIDLKSERVELLKKLGVEEINNEELMGHLMYPNVFADYIKRSQKYGPVSALPTCNFFYGMQPSEQISIYIEQGKTLEISMLAMSEVNEQGEVQVFFELNGQPRTISIVDRSVSPKKAARIKADLGNDCHVSAPMPGIIASVNVAVDSKVKKGDLLLTIEAMKMESSLYAERDGIIKRIHAEINGQIDVNDLLIELVDD